MILWYVNTFPLTFSLNIGPANTYHIFSGSQYALIFTTCNFANIMYTCIREEYFSLVIKKTRANLRSNNVCVKTFEGIYCTKKHYLYHDTQTQLHLII